MYMGLERIMNTNKPDWNDVYDLKEGFNAWRRTYEYRGIKYDIAMLYNSPSRYFVVELPEETKRISRLVDRINIRHDFLYCVCDRDESLRDMFYDAADRAEADIDWFLDDAANDIAARMRADREMFSDIIDERRLLIGAYTNRR